MNIKAFCKLGKPAAETVVSLIAVYGDEALKKKNVLYVIDTTSLKTVNNYMNMRNTATDQ
jgi:hypothetical protein